ncbi:glutathione peroxidase 7-like [Argopecten irradians]|uniref:glutathione peroxidase 7-like n=1 Tax=Argopecten irradians TaxID=31199 RepID=UPI003721586A
MASVNNINTLQQSTIKKKMAFVITLRQLVLVFVLISILKVTSINAIEESESIDVEMPTIDKESVNADDIQFADGAGPEENDFYSFDVVDMSGNPVVLEKYRGMVSLIVNVASECGFTDDHYKGLVKLQESFPRDEFTVLAFPCNQFGAQEPASNHEIEKFARTVYRVDFPMFAKINVLNNNVPDAWKYLIEHAGEPPNWNFWKYLVDRTGHLLNAWGPWVSVTEIYDDVKRAVEESVSHTVVTEPALDPHGGEL